MKNKIINTFLIISLSFGMGGLGLGIYSLTDTSRVGPPGSEGLQGIPGTDGIDGINGTDGTDGTAGINGTDGNDGEQGLIGPSGQDNGSMFEIQSGIYTGILEFGRTIKIPEGSTVIFQNASVFGAEIYVYGNLTVENCTVDQAINGFGNAFLNISSSSGIPYLFIDLFDSSRAIIYDLNSHRILLYGGYISLFDNSVAKISNSQVYITSNNYGIVNATGLKNGSSISMFSYSKATFRLSNLSRVVTYENPQTFLLQNTIVKWLICTGTASDYPYNNATVFKDGSSILISQSLVDGAQVIDI